MFKLMDKKIIAILHQKVLLNWPYVQNLIKYSLLIGPHQEKKLTLLHANNKGADQPVYSTQSDQHLYY